MQYFFCSEMFWVGWTVENSESYNCWLTRGADNSWHDGVDFSAHMDETKSKISGE